MCDGMCSCKKNREQIEERIKELLGELSRDLPIQEFYAIKNEILTLIDELD